MFALAKNKPSQIVLSLLIVVNSVCANSLPPRVQTEAWDFKDRIQKLPLRRALDVQSFYSQPIAHGRIQYSVQSKTLLLLSPDAERVLEFAFDGREFRLRGERSIQGLKERERFFETDLRSNARMSHAQGYFEVAPSDGRTWHYSALKNSKAMWSIALPFDPQAFSQDPQKRALWFWTSLPPQLFVIPASLGVASSFKWSADSEIISVEECAATTLVVAENTLSGFSRFVFLKNRAEPLTYTVFDFASESRSDVSRVLPLDSQCENFVVAGSFGLKQVRYPRGAL